MTRSLRRVAVVAVAAVTAVLASALPLHGFGIVVVVVRSRSSRRGTTTS